MVGFVHITAFLMGFSLWKKMWWPSQAGESNAFFSSNLAFQTNAYKFCVLRVIQEAESNFFPLNLFSEPLIAQWLGLQAFTLWPINK